MAEHAGSVFKRVTNGDDVSANVGVCVCAHAPAVISNYFCSSHAAAEDAHMGLFSVIKANLEANIRICLDT